MLGGQPIALGEDLLQGSHALHAILQQLAAGLQQPGGDLGQKVRAGDDFPLPSLGQYHQGLLERQDHGGDSRGIGVARYSHRNVQVIVVCGEDDR